MGEDTRKLRSRGEYLECPVIHREYPEGCQRRSLNPVLQAQSAVEATHFADVDSLALFDYENAPLRAEGLFEVGIGRESKEIAKKTIDRFSGDGSLAKLGAKNFSSGERSAGSAIQQACFTAAAGSDKYARGESAAIPVVQGLFQANEFSIAPNEESSIFNGRKPEE